MIAELCDAIIARLAIVPGVVTCERYAGQLEESMRATIKVPALLLAVGDWVIQKDPGTGEVDIQSHCSLYVAVRNAAGPEARSQNVDALCEVLLPIVRLNDFGVDGVGPAILDRVVTHYILEKKGVAVREIRWTHAARIGESVWDGVGVTPTEIYVGVNGGPHELVS